MQVELSQHARQRMKERLNIKNPNKGLRMATRALERGRFIQWQDEENPTHRKVVLEYSSNIFIFNQWGNLITVYPKSKKGHHVDMSYPEY